MMQQLIADLYRIVDQLEALNPGRHFTPDGHMVGSIGECLVAEKHGLTLVKASSKGFDAFDAEGRRVEIKCTQGDSVAFRSEPERCIVVKLMRDGTIEDVYNGPGAPVWALVKDKRLPKNGQHQISLNRLRALGNE